MFGHVVKKKGQKSQRDMSEDVVMAISVVELFGEEDVSLARRQQNSIG